MTARKTTAQADAAATLTPNERVEAEAAQAKAAKAADARAKREAAKAERDAAKAAKAAEAEAALAAQCEYAEDGRRCRLGAHGDDTPHRLPRVLSADNAAARAELAAALAEAATGDLAIPAGYAVHYAYPAGHSRLSNDGTVEGPKWLARCDVHGTTTTVEPDTAKAAKAAGFLKNRRAWCKPCDKAAKAAERDAAKADEAKAARLAERAAAKAAKDAASDASAEHDAASKSGE